MLVYQRVVNSLFLHGYIQLFAAAPDSEGPVDGIDLAGAAPGSAAVSNLSIWGVQ